MEQQTASPTGTSEPAEPRTYTIPPTQSHAAATGPTPAHFFETLAGYQKTAALKAGVELDLFTAIGEGAQTVEQIARRCCASERGTRMLCDYLVVNQFLTKADSRYGLTEDSAVFLDRRSPACWAGVMEFLLSPHLTDAFQDLAVAVRKGGTLMPDDGALAPDHPMWVKFARAMVPMMMMPAQMIAEIVNGPMPRHLKVLDIAAGHGLFGITIAQKNPQAEIVALDWPNVLEVAKENAERAGVTDRYSTIPGSAFDADYGSDYDVVLLTNFMHHFNMETNEALLRKVNAALSGTGRVVALEFVPSEDRVSPPIPASFVMFMLATTPDGDAYTHSQFTQMYQDAGFSRCEQIRLDPSPQSVVIGYKQR